MMFRTGFFWRFLLALLLIGLLTAGGVALYRTGWAQGYQAAVLTSNGSGSEGAPNLPFYGGVPRPYFWPGFGFPFFFGPFLWIGFFLLVFFLVGNLFRFWGWRRWGRGPWYGGWDRGPMPPGSKEWEERHGSQNKPGGETPESSRENG